MKWAFPWAPTIHISSSTARARSMVRYQPCSRKSVSGLSAPPGPPDSAAPPGAGAASRCAGAVTAGWPPPLGCARPGAGGAPVFWLVHVLCAISDAAWARSTARRSSRRPGRRPEGMGGGSEARSRRRPSRSRTRASRPSARTAPAARSSPSSSSAPPRDLQPGDHLPRLLAGGPLLLAQGVQGATRPLRLPFQLRDLLLQALHFGRQGPPFGPRAAGDDAPRSPHRQRHQRDQ